MEDNGSIWRKWDLHIHTPSTKLNNQYKDTKTDKKFDKFIDLIEKSDNDVFGVTDYFGIESYNTFLDMFESKYPNSTKVFFPNIEFRLDSKNSKDDHIQIHIIFSNEAIAVDKITNFLNRLELVSTASNKTKKYCCPDDLNSIGYDKAMVSKQALLECATSNFSKEEYLVVVV